MTKFHVNHETGNAGPCKAQKGGCPFGGENEHYDTVEDARRAYEKVKEGTPWGSVAKKKKTTAPPAPSPADVEKSETDEVKLTSEERETYDKLHRQYRQYLAQEFDHSGIYKSPEMSIPAFKEKIDALALKGGLPTSKDAEDAHALKWVNYIEEGFTADVNNASNLPSITYSRNPTPDEQAYAFKRERQLKRQYSSALRARDTLRKSTDVLGVDALTKANDYEKKALELHLEILKEREVLVPKRTLFNRKEVNSRLDNIATLRASTEDLLSKFK